MIRILIMRGTVTVELIGSMRKKGRIVINNDKWNRLVCVFFLLYYSNNNIRRYCLASLLYTVSC